MTIVFNCPHCLFTYRLPEKFAGKQARCKNPECRKLITIPKPITVPSDGPQLSAEEADAAALAALADEAPSQAEQRPEESTIPVNCPFCDHKWTVPRAMAGKNVLCPNPECRQRVRVDQPKDEGPTDWRQQKARLPSGAKQNFQKLEGVQDAADVTLVSGTALREADATGVEVEPRTLQEKLTIAVTVLALLGGLVAGVTYLLNRRTVEQEDRLMAEARTAYERVAPQLNPGDAALTSALLHLASVEYLLRQNDPRKTQQAHHLLGKASEEIRRQPPSPGRHALAAELALATLHFAGTEDQVKEQIRFRWLPDVASNRPLRINEKVPTIHEELGRALALLATADVEFRLALARRLARELTRRGQAELAANIIPLTLFTDAERDEARAVVALEVFRADRSSPIPQQTAHELKVQKASASPSTQTLFSVLQIDKPVLFGPPPPGSGPVPSDGSVVAYTGLRLLENQPDQALALAKRGSRPELQLKLLALCAEWSDDAGPALEAAVALAKASKGKREVTFNPSHLVRLALVAAGRGRTDDADLLADTLNDDGLRAWTKAAALRERLTTTPRDRAEETWAAVPDDPKQFRAGHALGRLLVARQNAKLSHDRPAEQKATSLWPEPARPFALAGIALGLQDH